MSGNRHDQRRGNEAGGELASIGFQLLALLM
jgi:hypothetical protein